MDRQRSTNKETAVLKRTVTLNGRRTAVSLENEFWHMLDEIAVSQNITRPKLIERIDRDRDNPNLSSAIRLFVFNYIRTPPLSILGTSRPLELKDYATR